MKRTFLRSSGTSYAAPMVAAAAGLMLTANPDLKWYEGRDLLCQSAFRPRMVGDLDPTEGLWEKDDAGRNHFNELYGCGRLDVHAAVIAAATYVRLPANQRSCGRMHVCDVLQLRNKVSLALS